MSRSACAAYSVYLAKTAEQKSEKKMDEKSIKKRHAPGTEAFRGARTGLLMGVPLGLLSAASTVGMGGGETQEAKALVSKLLRTAKAREIPVEKVPHYLMSYYHPKTEFVHEHFGLPEKVNPFVAGHEVGHATGGETLRKFLQRAGRIGYSVSPLAGIGLLGHAALTAEPGEDMPVTGYIAPGAAAAGPAFRQAEELRATIRANKLLGRAGINVPGLLRRSVQQQVGYLLGHLGMIAPFALGAYALNKHQQDTKKKLLKAMSNPAITE